MTLLALVEPGVAATAQFGALQPVEHEQRAFDAPQLLRELPQHGGGRHGAGFQRYDQA
jgi:hypothetical protein